MNTARQFVPNKYTLCWRDSLSICVPSKYMIIGVSSYGKCLCVSGNI